MPELPEVETVCRGLAKVLPGHIIRAVRLNRDGMRTPFPPALGKIANIKITAIDRRAKYVLLRLGNAQTLIVHLGMSGRMVIYDESKKYVADKHDHLILQMDNGVNIVLNDPRRFGLADLVETKSWEQHRLFAHLGPEPLEKTFNETYLADKIKSKKVAIKLAIMDQQVVVGVGNIYASEALFAAGIDPRRAANAVKPAEIKKLVAAIKQVLKKAIKAGGSSLRDYVQTDGELGYFQHQFTVYDKEGLKCRDCTCNIKKAGGVQRITQGARSTFYCPVKQA
jgi:formamidopyrimidine-DNA glycosylase